MVGVCDCRTCGDDDCVSHDQFPGDQGSPCEPGGFIANGMIEWESDERVKRELSSVKTGMIVLRRITCMKLLKQIFITFFLTAPVCLLAQKDSAANDGRKIYYFIDADCMQRKKRR